MLQGMSHHEGCVLLMNSPTCHVTARGSCHAHHYSSTTFHQKAEQCRWNTLAPRRSQIQVWGIVERQYLIQAVRTPWQAVHACVLVSACIQHSYVCIVLGVNLITNALICAKGQERLGDTNCLHSCRILASLMATSPFAR